MKNKIFYIHGYGSDRNSRKFLALKKHFLDRFEYGFMEWKPEDDISLLLNEAEVELDAYENPILFGDSTGANFAYQLYERRKAKNKKSILMLSSPLLTFQLRISDREFSDNLKQQLIPISNPKNAMIIATPTDEVLDQTWLFEKEFENIELMQVEDGHRLMKFNEYLDEIDKYISQF